MIFFHDCGNPAWTKSIWKPFPSFQVDLKDYMWAGQMKPEIIFLTWCPRGHQRPCPKSNLAAVKSQTLPEIWLFDKWPLVQSHIDRQKVMHTSPLCLRTGGLNKGYSIWKGNGDDVWHAFSKMSRGPAGWSENSSDIIAGWSDGLIFVLC